MTTDEIVLLIVFGLIVFSMGYGTFRYGSYDGLMGGMGDE